MRKLIKRATTWLFHLPKQVFKEVENRVPNFVNELREYCD